MKASPVEVFETVGQHLDTISYFTPMEKKLNVKDVVNQFPNTSFQFKTNLIQQNG